MPKKQVNTRMSEATREKLDYLTERYGTQTTAVAVAIDRLYQAEGPKGEAMNRAPRYFECRNCGQVVQGWHAAMEWVKCCDNKDMVEIAGPDAELERAHAEAIQKNTQTA